MPSTPFIDGLPGSDRLVRRLSALCSQEIVEALRQHMTDAYYRAPMRLVDAGLPRIIASLQAEGVLVHALTSRAATWRLAGLGDHNEKVLEVLTQHGVCFSSFSPAQLAELGVSGANTPAGGVLYAGGELVDKAALMQRVTRGAVATLVDNSAHKLVRATSRGQACVHGVHFTAAWAREASDAERRRWIVELRRDDVDLPAVDPDEGI